MAAGNGKRCQACYWNERCERSAAQLLELLQGKRARQAFTAFATWLKGNGLSQRAGARLPVHAKFFEMLDSTGDEAWTGEFLLKRFGTATLRRYELPVRWLQSEAGVALPAEGKAREADVWRVRKALAMAPAGTVARELLEAFEKELRRRRDEGRLTERSMRLAFRPAVALLAVEDPLGRRMPTQPALERYLANTPGQRAAVSTFLGFLKLSRGVELRLPAKPAANSPTARKALEKEIASLMAPPVDAVRLARRWAPLALRYFHRLSAADAKAIVSSATSQPGMGGTILTYSDQHYWIPAEPTVLPPQPPHDENAQAARETSG